MKKTYNVEEVTAITFYVGGFFQGHRHIDIRKKENRYIVTALTNRRETKATTIEIPETDWRTIIHTILERFGVASWNKEYNSDMLDGTQWKLSICLKNGHRTSSWGNNAYPQTFREFYTFMEHYYDLSESCGTLVETDSVRHLFG